MGLSIGDLSARTGVSVTTLRMWEARHGYPVPQRLPSGHRRYTERDAQGVGAVVALRDAGRTLAAAIDEVLVRGADLDLTRETTPDTARDTPRGVGPRGVLAAARHRGSVFAQVRSLHPGLATYQLKRPTLLGLSWAIEDEFCARADRAHLFGAFEQLRYLEGSRARWIALAKVAASAHVYATADPVGASTEPVEAGAEPVEAGAEPAGSPTGPSVALVRDEATAHVSRSDPAGSLYLVGLDDQHPMRTEWIVICDSAELPAALIARETAGPRHGQDRERRFESILTVDPVVVRDAARLCAAVAEEAGSPRARALVDELAAPPAGGAQVDLANLTRLLGRLVAYVDAAS